MKITATTHNEYMVETTDVHGEPCNHLCFLGGNILRNVPCKRGEINVHAPVRVILGPISFEKVTHLKCGESVTL